MNKHEYCRQLLAYRGRMMPLSMYLGGKWVFLKFILAGFGIVAISSSIPAIQILGGLAIGYALGKTIYGIRMYYFNRNRWVISDDLFDWNRVTEYAEGTPGPD